MTRARTDCLLVWGLAGSLLVGLLALTLLPWWLTLDALDARIASAEDRLGRYQRIAAGLPMLRDELERVRTDPALAGLYVQAATETIAGAELQRQLQQIIAAARGRLISVQLLPTTSADAEAPTRLHVRAQVQGTTATLFEILYRIEQARPLLFVERLSARSAAQPEQRLRASRAATPSLATAPEGALMLRLDVFGFVRGEEP
ncbi:general secretion pathway protein M [Marichromatium purpuratum 984]|uniref:General secretion pathway protein M n=1 Tax=Marichromatium purpuratum 984 TaxID=765910 RepID=W0E7C6_MARPU|nr:type II secretion system protein GspM [Marichromatium purpuratum]AHF05124.1 general secretion pathway protein M [Marichromatium purpuratum 984]